MRRLHAALAMPLLIGGTLVWLALNVAEAKQTLAYLTESFERTLNPTDLPDYKVNGLLVHTNDGWADIEVLKRSKELGFVSMSYIRRDISQNHKMPIFFDPSYRDVPWMHNDLVGTGIILDPGGAFVPLCMFIRDAASYNRSHFGCGGYKNRVIENFDWSGHFARYSFEAIPSRLHHENVAERDFQDVYDPRFGISSCHYYGIKDISDYDARLFGDYRTQCAFAIDKESFSLALEFSEEHMRKYNEFLVREWSDLANPVAATFYVASAKRRVISAEDSARFRTKALEIQHSYYARTGRVMPVYRMNLDAFKRADFELLEYRFADNNPFSLLTSRVKHVVSTVRVSSRQEL